MEKSNVKPIVDEVINRAARRSTKHECPFNVALADELAEILQGVYDFCPDVCETKGFWCNFRKHLKWFLTD